MFKYIRVNPMHSRGNDLEIEVKLFANFRDNRFKVKSFKIDNQCKVIQIVENLGIDPDEIGVLMKNGRHCTLHDTLTDRDTLGIFPLVGGG